MQLSDRISAFANLSNYIDKNSEEILACIGKAKFANPWFTDESIWTALEAIKDNFLNENNLTKWLDNYELSHEPRKSVGLILAGNIPLVGFHDVMSVLLTGNKCLIKHSEKDAVLIPYLLNKLVEIEPRFKDRIEIQDRLKAFEAIIATGSDNTGKYFEQYFSRVPNVIRKNRNAIGVIYNDVNDATLKKIGSDIFKYYGLGCRNVSKLFFEESFKIDRLFEAVYEFKNIINHNKYKNNYDYSNALFLLNNEKFLTNNFLILRPQNNIASRISTVNFEYFSDTNKLVEVLNQNKSAIQCIVSSKPLPSIKTFALGEAQNPTLLDYADGVDTISFLINL